MHRAFANSAMPDFVPVARALAAVMLAVAIALPVRAQAPQQPADAQAASAKPRPKIGLVLSGGGARGITHIGVLKVMEQLRVPVDYIAATSMGAIVGGLYASGMSPAEMERQITTVSWPTLLSDSPPRRDVGFRTKEEDAKFPLAFEIGIRDWQFRAFKGALSGSNLENFLHELTRSVDNVPTFDQLPIPFRAIATDMVTGREVIFDRGPIYRAMRASMSVPGMFTPAEIDGRVLGDGGLVDNLPVDVVRAMGADIVIAVNIGTPLMSKDQLSSMVGYTAQMINILTEQNVRAQRASLRPGDILIEPDLGDLTFVDFTSGPKFIALGEKAAEGMREKLAAVSESETEYIAFQASLLVPVENIPHTLEFIKFEGTHFANPQVLEDQMQTKVGEPFHIDVLEKDLSRLYGRGDFEQIDYRLVQDAHQQGLDHRRRRKNHGGRITCGSDCRSIPTCRATRPSTFWSAHKRTGSTAWARNGSTRWRSGTVNRYGTEFYQPLSVGNYVFASAYGLIQRGPEYVFEGDQRLAEYERAHRDRGCRPRAAAFDGRRDPLGYLWTHQRGNPTIAVPGFPAAVSTESGARLLARWDSLDNPFFPRRGLKVVGELFCRQQPPERGRHRRLHEHGAARRDLCERRTSHHADGFSQRHRARRCDSQRADRHRQQL